MGCQFTREVYIAKETYTPLLSEGDGDLNRFMLSIKIDDELSLTKRTPAEAEAVKDEIEKFGDIVFHMKNRRTKKKGFVPSTYMAKKGSLECEPWYFGKIGRSRASQILSYPVNNHGSFLIRESNKPGCFVLSYKQYTKEAKFQDQHLLIEYQHGEYFISAKIRFSSLSTLVAAAQANRLPGLPICISSICKLPRPTPNTPFEDQTSWLLNRDELNIPENPINSGNFGEVYKGTWRGRVDVAIKKLKVDDGNNIQKAQMEFEQETMVLKHLHHPNLVQIFGVCIESPFLIVTEWLDNGDLKSFLKEERQKQNLGFDDLIRISGNIASAMTELSRLQIIHRDLAARNVLMDKWGQAKVADFGMSRINTEYSTMRSFIPVKWSAPEVLKFHTFTTKSDVWSFGITLYEIFSFGAAPYGQGSVKGQELLQQLAKGYRLPMPAFMGTEEANINAVYLIMLACWLEDPQKRPSFESLKNDLENFELVRDEKYDLDPSDYMRANDLNECHTFVLPKRKGEKKRRRKPKK
ncbi:tyrosine-protein kinase SRK3-like isoform X1 [Tigriopus californicus]|uniref:tyrosine-protein kinase SRK3-like isoform X1 n=1 Tax=Tigriopus californicus TaxID=6832 RepID=UPI0027DA4D47|nr:tyrosine-protein kinase SRK3-like isoform X1 [Tigriopus californicus]